MITNRFNSFGINDDSDHCGSCFPTLFPFASKNCLFNYCQKSDRTFIKEINTEILKSREHLTFLASKLGFLSSYLESLAKSQFLAQVN
jgi:hypothetical protein